MRSTDARLKAWDLQNFHLKYVFAFNNTSLQFVVIIVSYSLALRYCHGSQYNGSMSGMFSFFFSCC